MTYSFNEKKHIHLLDAQPLYGTSTVIKEVMPPFLAKWGAQCAVDFFRENIGEILKFPIETNKLGLLLDRAVMAWSKVRQDKAEKGTEMHERLEHYILICLSENGGNPMAAGKEMDEKIQKFAGWSEQNIKRFIFAEKYTYSKTTWTGGIVDCLAEMKDGTLAVIDFKSAKEAYFNHFAQVSGYALQLEENGYGNADGSDWKSLSGKIGALIVVPFGAKILKPVKVENVEGFKDIFRHLVEVYKFLLAFKNK